MPNGPVTCGRCQPVFRPSIHWRFGAVPYGPFRVRRQPMGCARGRRGASRRFRAHLCGRRRCSAVRDASRWADRPTQRNAAMARLSVRGDASAPAGRTAATTPRGRVALPPRSRATSSVGVAAPAPRLVSHRPHRPSHADFAAVGVLDGVRCGRERSSVVLRCSAFTGTCDRHSFAQRTLRKGPLHAPAPYRLRSARRCCWRDGRHRWHR